MEIPAMILSGVIRLAALWYSLSLFRKGHDWRIFTLFVLIALSTVSGGLEVGRLLAQYPYTMNLSFIMILHSATQFFCVYLVDYLITNKKESNERLKAIAEQDRQNQENLLQLTLKSANIKIWDWDANTNKVITLEVDPENDQLQMLDHLTLEDFLKTFGEGDTQNLREALQEAIKADASCAQEYQTRSANGEQEWYEAIGSAYYNRESSGSHFVGTIRPITDRKKALFKSARFQENLRLAAQSARLHFWEWDLKLKTFHLYSTDMTSHSSRPEEIVFSRIHPEDLLVVKQSIQKTLSTGGPLEVQARYQVPDESYRWFHFYADTVLDIEGRAISLTGVLQDVHDRKSVEEQLKLSELRFRRAIDAGKLLVYDLNLKNNELHTYASPETQEYYIDSLGVSFDSSISFAETLQLVYPDDHQKIFEIIENHEISQIPEAELRLVRKDGGIETVSISVEVIRDSSGQAIITQGFVQNITEKRVAKPVWNTRPVCLKLWGNQSL